MRERDLEDKAAVEAAVRQVADDFLSDPNITSVGIGYKVVEGRPTETLALQFTVATKLTSESLQAASTRPIPATITANGIEFETDVIERRFTLQPVAVAAAATTERTRRRDPMQPGISIGHPTITAGTLGCLVTDRVTGQPRLLSNWHVFQGEQGALGDTIVQPGAYDDPRTDENTCGALERSFLGLAGDCAIATIIGRGVIETLLELDVGVRRIGDPQLGDVVVKSGRTTGVTYGRVTRIHTISALDYGSAGSQRIGGFEIGPDPDRPAAADEISMGGDSGSAWMSVSADGTVEDRIVGLHFGGEAVEPSEFALACNASSVFATLEIEPLVLDDSGAVVPVRAAPVGFDPEFLPGHRVEVPAAGSPAVQEDYALTTSGETVRDYTHFSLAMSAGRRFCRWVAWNVDGNGLLQLSRNGIDFRLDDQYDPDVQTGEALYADNPLDRGHVARRADLLWGPPAEAQQANVDSFHFTNITPQLDDFNQSFLHGLWGELENAIYEATDVDNLRLSVFGGPVFKPTDFPYRDRLIPRSYWKLIAYVEDAALQAKAFVLTQDDLEDKVESLGLEPFKLYQVTVAVLSALVSLDFGTLAEADTLLGAPEALVRNGARRIQSRSEIVV